MTAFGRKVALGASSLAQTPLVADGLAGLFRLLPEPIRECLRRCAVPQSFDATTYEQVLRPAGVPAIEALAQVAHFAAASDQAGRYQLTGGLRQAALADWWAAEGRPAGLQLPIPEPLARLAAELAKGGRPGDRAGDRAQAIARLDLALLYDPGLAASMFRALYQDADRVHDLATCRAVLDTLDAPDRLPLLGPDLAALRNDTATYLAARTLWSDNFHRSARYVPRAGAEAALESLLAPEGPRMLQLYARGGMGKSLQLKWFTARRCCPAPARIPCALLDFDLIQPVAAARHPWLLLLEAAVQLDRQMPGAPFQELLAAHGHYRPLLGTGSDPALSPRATTQADGDDVLARFCAALAQLSADRPAVIVFDTFEEAFQPAVQPAGILQLAAEVSARLPGLRFLIAGRYDLLEPRAGWQAPGLAVFELPPLTEAEQRRYLRDVRGIDDEPTIQQIGWLSEGLPLTLAMYANMVERFDGVSAEELASYGDPGLQTAIQRVVARVPDHRVRWLLRYGVIPRELHYDFVVSVMWPYLSAGMSGRTEADDPARDERPHGAEPVFRTDLEPLTDESELRSVWNSLLAYAADYGWVSTTPGADTVRFRRDLMVPLRRIVSPHPVYARLQRDAADWFERQAAAVGDEERWAELLSGAVYHRFQVDAEAAAASWRQAVARARAAGRDDWCLYLAGDLLDRDLVNRQGEAIPPMTYQVLAEAQLERARAAAGLAEASYAGREDPLWSEMEQALAAAARLAGRADVELPETQVVVLQARLATARGHAVQATHLLATELLATERLAPTSPRDAADAERALGHALSTFQGDGAGAHLASSYRHALAAGDAVGARRSALLWVRWHTDRGDHEQARVVLEAARQQGAIGDPDPEADLLEARVLTDAGAAEKCTELADRLLETGAGDAGSAYLALAWAQLSLDDPTGCVISAEEALERLSAATGAGDNRQDEALAVRGLGLAEWHAAGYATADLLGAASRARVLGVPDRAGLWAAEAALVKLSVAGDLREAAQCLDEAQRSTPEPGGMGWVTTQCAQARLLAARGEGERAVAVLAQARELLGVAGRPTARIALAVEALAACAPVEEAGWLSELTGCLAAVTPPAARPALVRELRRVRVLQAGELTDRLLALLSAGSDLLGRPPGSPAPALSAEPAANGWLLAEVLRVCGRPAAARRLLNDTLERRDDELLGWWRWLEGVSRLGDPSPTEPFPPLEVFDDPQAQPLAASCLVQLARRRLELDGPDAATERLDLADTVLDRAGRRSRWRALSALGRAEIAEQRDDLETSLREAGEAVREFAELGDAAGRAEVARRFTAVGDYVEDPDTVEIRFGLLEAEQLKVSVRRADSPELAHSVSRKELGELASGDILTRTRTTLEPVAGGWARWSAEVGERLLGAQLLGRLQPAAGQVPDLRMVFSSRDLAHLPWELCRAWDCPAPLTQAPGVRAVYRSLRRYRREEAGVRAVQSALLELGLYHGTPDGFSGQRTSQAVRAFQQEQGLAPDGVPGPVTFAALREIRIGQRPRRPLRVVVLRPDPARQLERQRGELASGSSLLGGYLKHGAEVQLIDDPTAEHARALAESGFVPDVVHVTAPVRYGGGATVLDLGGDAGRRTGTRGLPAVTELPVSAVADLVQQLGRGGSLPLMLLDVPLPGTITEAVRALSARNSFCYQLFELGGIQAVLAIGLARPYEQIEIMDVIVAGLSAGQDVAAVAQQVQRARPAGLDVHTDLAFAAASLYLERRPSTLFPVWAS